MKIFAQLISLLLLTANAWSETKYIDDTLLVPLRSGEGTGFRIVHKGLKSGTQLEVISRNVVSGYSQVRTRSGIEGYLPSRYLINTPIARDRLITINKELETFREENASLSTQVDSLQNELNTLKQTHTSTAQQLEIHTQELSRVKSVSSDALNLERRNIELREGNETLRNELELLQVENARLNDKSESNMLLIGGGLVLLGAILAIILPLLKSGKRGESWA
jgi:SH3 domain protein